MKTKVTEANQYSNHVFLKIHDYSEFASPFAYAVVFFMLYKPSCFEDVSLVDTLWNLAKFGISLLFIGLYFPVSKSIVKYPFLIFSIVLFSTILQNGIPAKVISHWIPGLGIICWLGANKNSLREIAKVFCICGGTMIILNTLTVFACPNGMWIRSEASTPIWFLGQKQDFICCYLPTAFFMVIPKKTDGFVFFNKAIVLFMVLPFLITRPIGLILCLLSFVGLIFFEKIVGKNFNVKFLFCSFVLLEILSVLIAYIFTKMTVLQLALSAIETDGVDKSQTMGTRFGMWTYAWESFLKNPILGRGQVSETVWYKTSGLDFYHTIIHNLPLDIMFTGGGLALIFYILWNISMVRKLSVYRNVRICRYMSYGFFSLCFISLTECPYNPMIFAIYGFIMCLPYVFVRGELKLLRKDL